MLIPSNNVQMLHQQHHMLHIFLKMTRIHIRHERVNPCVSTNGTVYFT